MENKNEISWSAPEFVYYHKTAGWYTAFFAIAAVFIGWAAWRKDFFLISVLLIIFILAFVFGRRQPKNVKITLTEQGLKIKGLLYRYDTVLKSFWIVYRLPEAKTLNFETTNYLNHEITVQLGDQNPLEARDFLLKYLPEDLEREESTFDKWLRLFRF